MRVGALKEAEIKLSRPLGWEKAFNSNALVPSVLRKRIASLRRV